MANKSLRLAKIGLKKDKVLNQDLKWFVGPTELNFDQSLGLVLKLAQICSQWCLDLLDF